VEESGRLKCQKFNRKINHFSLKNPNKEENPKRSERERERGEEVGDVIDGFQKFLQIKEIMIIVLTFDSIERL
jgi:hypothetical protein